MKQKVVIKLHMYGDKARRKAMKTAVSPPGVLSAQIGGEQDQLVVVGEDFDSVELAKSLRKKMGFAEIVSVEEKKEEEKKPESTEQQASVSLPISWTCHEGYAPSYYVRERNPDLCSIL